jgi:hypothetical protein
MSEVILYTRQHCHLCDQARQVLLEHGLTPRQVDIDSDEQLRALFDTCVPVVEINGKIRFRGQVEPRLLRRIVRNKERRTRNEELGARSKKTGADRQTTSLGLFAKYWQPGHVKTRLAAGMGPERAAAIYGQFVCTLLQRLAPLAEDRLLSFAPKQRAADFAAILPDHWRQEPQADGDLGQRMKDYFVRRFAEGHRRVVLLGTDSPNLPLEFISRALAELEKHEVVLGPTEDGGYYLVGARGPVVPSIFSGIAWSTSHVWQETLETLQRAGNSFTVLPSWYDVDEKDDYQRLLHELAGSQEPLLQKLHAQLTDIP